MTTTNDLLSEAAAKIAELRTAYNTAKSNKARRELGEELDWWWVGRRAFLSQGR